MLIKKSIAGKEIEHKTWKKGWKVLVFIILALLFVCCAVFIYYTNFVRLNPTKRERDKLDKIIIKCESEVMEEYGEQDSYQMIISDEEYKSFVESCVNKINKNDKIKFIYEE